MKKTYLFILFILSIQSPIIAQTVIANWNFDTITIINSNPVPPDIGAGYATCNTGGAIGIPSGNGSLNSYRSTNWDVGEYFQFHVSTTGLSNICISFDQYASDTGPANFKIAYSNDSINFTDVVNSNYTIPNSTQWGSTRYYQYNFSFDLSGISSLNNQSDIFIRLINTDTVSINGNAVGSSGTSYVDNVLITSGFSTYYYTGTGSISDTANWGSNTDGSGTSPASLLIAANIYHITNNDTVQMSSNIGFGGMVLIDSNVNLMTPTAVGGSFTLNNSASLVVSSTGSLTIYNGSGTFNFRNRPVVLQSDTLGSAKINTIPVGGQILEATNVTIERYIGQPSSPKRAWRLLAAPLDSSGAPSILNAWQEGSAGTNPNPGFGTWVTRPGGSTADGFDAASNGTSIQYWDGSNLVTPTNTDSTLITDYGGAWFLFVRGDKSITTAGVSGNTTLRMTGTIHQGNITAGIPGTTASGFSLIPNPYPAAVDYDSILAGNPGLPNSFYIWDANHINTVGGYRTVERTGPGTYQQTPDGGSTQANNTARYIRSGQAFFLQGNTTVDFTENMKTNATPTFNVFKTASNTEEMAMNLFKITANNDTLLVDGIRIKYDSDFNDSVVSGEDILKIKNLNENLAVFNDSLSLVVDKRASIISTDTVQLKFNNTQLTNYQFTIPPHNISTNVFLIDNYNNTITPLSNTNPTTYNFTITMSAGSWNPFRFYLIAGAIPLQVSGIELKGIRQKNAIQLEWTALNEYDILNYNIEYSTNGKDFEKIHTVKATKNNHSNATYYYKTHQELAENNYFRIVSYAVNQSAVYSNTIQFKKTAATENTSWHVYPNPVIDNKIYIQANNAVTGDYTATLYNTLGQAICTKKLSVLSGEPTFSMEVATLKEGVYQLSISHEGHTGYFTQKIFIQH